MSGSAGAELHRPTAERVASMLLTPILGSVASDVARRIVAQPDRYALYSDFDGTLVEIALRPEDVFVPPDLAQRLARVRAVLGGAFALITGRTLKEIDGHLGDAGLEASGLHGIEFRYKADAAKAPVREAPRELIAAVVAIVAADAGLRLENKGPILAIHYREAPAAGGRLRFALEEAVAALRLPYHLKDGRAVIEIIPDGTSKGTALADFMRRTPYAGRIPIMIGDDRADEDAFAVAEAAGGLGLKVAGEHFRGGDEPFRNPGEVRAFLAEVAAATAR